MKDDFAFPTPWLNESRQWANRLWLVSLLVLVAEIGAAIMAPMLF